MIRVITYGTFDLLHEGHIKLLQRAKALGDYLIVGVTSDDYDKTRGKINLQQSLMERVEAVRNTGLADEIIIEEYEGQKIDDIKKYGIDIFTVGSDWEGYFDYLNEFCKVVYLPRTVGISSSDLRDSKSSVKLGIVGDASFLNKVWRESKCVNGINVVALCTCNPDIMDASAREEIETIVEDYDTMLGCVDAVYIRSFPKNHYEQISKALTSGKHVLCESPVCLSTEQTAELFELAKRNKLVFMEAVKTAYATAYSRLLLIVKGGKIGDVVSVDATCTSLKEKHVDSEWSNIYEWGPTALLPVFQVLGTDYNSVNMYSRMRDSEHDSFTKMDFAFDNAVASIKVADGVKSEGELIISGTKGYIYVPAPWWKTDYFEIRYENQSDNRRYFYQLDGEGIRYELVAFARAVSNGGMTSVIDEDITYGIAKIMEKYNNKKDVVIIG